MANHNGQAAKAVYAERAPNVLCYGEPLPMAVYNESLAAILTRRAMQRHGERVTPEEIKNLFAVVCAEGNFFNADMKARVYETFLRAAHVAEQRGSADPNNVVVSTLGKWITLKLHGQVAQVWRNQHVKEIVDQAANAMRKACLINYTKRPPKKAVMQWYENCTNPEDDLMERIVFTIRQSLGMVA